MTAGRVLRARRGGTAVEFALVGGALVTLLIGILETGRYMATQEAVRSVAAEGVRLALLRGSANLNGAAAPCRNLSGSLAGAVAGGPMLRAADLSITLGGCQTQDGMTSVTVTVTYPFAPSVPLLALAPRTLREQGTATIF